MPDSIMLTADQDAPLGDYLSFTVRVGQREFAGRISLTALALLEPRSDRSQLEVLRSNDARIREVIARKLVADPTMSQIALASGDF
jgi:hypothetical protein